MVKANRSADRYNIARTSSFSVKEKYRHAADLAISRASLLELRVPSCAYLPGRQRSLHSAGKKIVKNHAALRSRRAWTCGMDTYNTAEPWLCHIGRVRTAIKRRVFSPSCRQWQSLTTTGVTSALQCGRTSATSRSDLRSASHTDRGPAGNRTLGHRARARRRTRPRTAEAGRVAARGRHGAWEYITSRTRATCTRPDVLGVAQPPDQSRHHVCAVSHTDWFGASRGARGA